MMNNIKNQFLGFYHTNYLFKQLYGLKQFEFEQIDLTNLQIEKLQIKQKLPLGKRVEFFFEHYLYLCNRYELVQKNIQIIDNKKTLGEIDFIIFDKYEDCLKHIELIYKYYIYDKNFDNELVRYIGPNRNDTLIKKLDKLKHKQLPLLFNKKTSSFFNEINIDNIKQEVCFKANIYIPFYSKNLDIKFKENIRGFYISFMDFENDQYFKNSKYIMPHRYDWIDFKIPNINFLTYDEMILEIQFFIKHKKSPLLWIKEGNNIFQLFILF